LLDLSFNASTFLPLAVLGASFAGSLHCVSMCGGLIAAVSTTRTSRASYHLGRLIGYSTLGALAGLLGEGILKLGSLRWLSLGSGILMGLLFIAMGYSCWRYRGFHLWILPKGGYGRIFQNRSPLLLGLGTAALPCGWLQMFVVGAVATQSPLRGALFMALFWLGTLPALSFAQLIIRRILNPISARAPKFAAGILMAAGLLNIGARVLEARNPAADPPEQRSHSCH
jgi:uncharacterized protein